MHLICACNSWLSCSYTHCIYFYTMAEEHYLLTSEYDNGNVGFFPNIQAASDSGHYSSNSNDDCYPLSNQPPPNYALLHWDQQRHHYVCNGGASQIWDGCTRSQSQVALVSAGRRWCLQSFSKVPSACIIIPGSCALHTNLVCCNSQRSGIRADGQELVQLVWVNENIIIYSPGGHNDDYVDITGMFDEPVNLEQQPLSSSPTPPNHSTEVATRLCTRSSQSKSLHSSSSYRESAEQATTNTAHQRHSGLQQKNENWSDVALKATMHWFHWQRHAYTQSITKFWHTPGVITWLVIWKDHVQEERQGRDFNCSWRAIDSSVDMQEARLGMANY